jgi:hypothetical protein
MHVAPAKIRVANELLGPSAGRLLDLVLVQLKLLPPCIWGALCWQSVRREFENLPHDLV